MQLTVMKFGGTSVQDGAALRRLIGIVRAERAPRVVIVSALAGVTDALCAMAEQGVSDAAALHMAQRLFERHADIVTEFGDGETRRSVIERVRARFSAAAAVVRGAAGHVGPCERDALLAIGELASSEVVAAVLTAVGLPARWVDARQVILTDEHFGSARPEAVAVRHAAGSTLAPIIAAGDIPVLGGFVGASPSGLTTTLGRGGSDYSAALVGAALDAHEIQIWTDVDGVLTADPRSVPGARLVSDMSYAEAYELARFGAKVLHWGTLEPAAGHDIPVRVLNARVPDRRRGTLITSAKRSVARVIGFAHRWDVAVLDIRPRGVSGSHAFVHAALAWLERAGDGLTVVSLSPTRLTVIAADGALLEATAAALGEFGSPQILTGRAVVAIVGHHAAADADVWRVVRQCAGALDLAIPAQSGDALVCVTTRGAGPDLLARLHEHCFATLPASQDAAQTSLPAGTAVGAQSISGVTL